MHVLGPTYYSEWEYTNEKCKTLRIALFGEVHQEPTCTDKKTVLPIETFLSCVLRDTTNQDRFAMDLFLEVEYAPKDLKQAMLRGKTERTTAGATLAPSKIYDIQQRFAPELKTTQRVTHGFRAHYIDYRHGGAAVPVMIGYNLEFEITGLVEDLRDQAISGQAAFRAGVNDIKKKMPRPRDVRRALLALLDTERVRRQYSPGVFERLRPLLEKEVKDRVRFLDRACTDVWGVPVPMPTPNHLRNAQNRIRACKKITAAVGDVEHAMVCCRALVMDFYALGRILKCTRPRIEKPGLAIVYTGSDHSRFYARVFRALGLRRLSPVVDIEDTDRQCIPVESIRFLELLSRREKRHRQGDEQQGAASKKNPRV